MRLDLSNSDVLTLLESIGIPYWWGEGTLRTKWLNDRKGYDCSGFVQGALVKLGIVPKDAWVDQNAYNLANACLPILVPSIGDLAFYGKPVSHVMMCISVDLVIGATGGNSKIVGQIPSTMVKIEHFKYRKDFVTFGTIKEMYRG